MPLWLHPHITPHPPSRSLCELPTCLQHRPHTCLIPNTTYHPYPCVAPSRYASDVASPLPLNMLILPLHPYVCQGSQKIKPSLMPVQAPDVSHAHPYASTGSQQFKPLLLLGKAPKNSNHSLHQCRLLTVHKQTLMLVQVSNNSNNSL
ncbi:hypothetical protein O181_102736 [Austropuccinia psidii MF-1]|uniref:Uncharacterized protein n=1 Tax=Austropuccinia psidii MF-1 TaxID=1389203 RepID=A0A9Q3JJ99_9BASI|nr:hypothetical protein [Austropuccinia psidii MF-1]